jgi:putative ABC transport system ATP-binding protein
MTTSMITLADIYKSFQEGAITRSVLKQVNASFGQGEFTAILGKSGSGKSTLLNLISGIDRPDRGEIWINGENITTLTERDRTLFRRYHIGFVFQFFNLLPTLTVLENVILPLEINGTAIKTARQRAQPLLEAVGLSDRAGTFPDRLSGGEQQRVAIARALVNDPQLVLADEPTGNLDRDTGEQILSLLDELTRKVGKNLVMVTHSISNASRADSTYRLEDGQLIKQPVTPR